VGHGFHVVQRYGNAVEGYYRLHGSELALTFYGDRVGRIGFGTPYYRAKNGSALEARFRSAHVIAPRRIVASTVGMDSSTTQHSGRTPAAAGSRLASPQGHSPLRERTSESLGSSSTSVTVMSQISTLR
jgi:hypothetical protein